MYRGYLMVAPDYVEGDMAKPQRKAEPVESADGLVLMEKGEETIAVHPTCVKAHVSAGWKVKEC